MEVMSCSWKHTKISFSNLTLLYWRLFEMNRQQTCRGSRFYVGLNVRNTRVQCSHPKGNILLVREIFGGERKKVRIRDPNEEERRAGNVNQIQPFSTSSSTKPQINVVTTRYWSLVEPYPTIDKIAMNQVATN